MTVRIWKFGSKEKEKVLAGHVATINCVSLSRDSTIVVSGSDDSTIRVWNMQNKKETDVLKYKFKIISTAIEPRNKYIVSGSVDIKFQVWRFLK